MDVRFQNESVFTISGPSGSGKTVLVQKLIKHRQEMFRHKINQVHWFYGIIAPRNLDAHIKTHKGLADGWSDMIKPFDMVILDDLFVEATNNKEVTNAFTRLAHHRPCTMIYITQNIFHQSRDSRTRNLNTHYLIAMKNPRDQLQISTISRQMFPGNHRFLVDVYSDVTNDDEAPYSYLLLDFRQETPSTLRVRTGIFPGEIYKVFINKMNSS